MGNQQLYMEQLETPRPHVWQDDATCRDTGYAIFEIYDEDSDGGAEKTISERIDITLARFEEASKICAICPVIADCDRDQSLDDREWTYRAGQFPTRFSGRKPGRPVGATQSNPDYSPIKRCNRGHPRIEGQARCQKCKNESARALNRRRKEEAQRAADGV